MTDNDAANYANDITRQIQEDIERQRGVDEAICRDEERLRIIETELNKISPRLADNRKYLELLKKHLPYRIRGHELLCEDLGLDRPNFNLPASNRQMQSNRGAEDTFDRITSPLVQIAQQQSQSPIGDQAAKDTLASRDPVDRETVEYLMRPDPRDSA